LEYLGLHNKPKAEVRLGHKLMGPEEEDKEEEELHTCAFSVIRREANKNFPLLGYHTASSGNFLPTFRDKLSIPSSRVKNPHFMVQEGFLTLEVRTDKLSRNFGEELPLFAAI
jgi:hypothetical protein